MCYWWHTIYEEEIPTYEFFIYDILFNGINKYLEMGKKEEI